MRWDQELRRRPSWAASCLAAARAGESAPAAADFARAASARSRRVVVRESLFGAARVGPTFASSVSQVITAPPCTVPHPISNGHRQWLGRPAGAGQRLLPGAQGRGAQLRLQPVRQPVPDHPNQLVGLASQVGRSGGRSGRRRNVESDRRRRLVRWWLFFLGCWFFSNTYKINLSRKVPLECAESCSWVCAGFCAWVPGVVTPCAGSCAWS